MFWTKLSVSTRKVILPTAVVCLAAIGLIAGAQLNSTNASTAASAAPTAATLFAVPAATFAGTNLGAIPDGPAAQCGTAGAARDVMFNVTGLSGAPTNVEIAMSFSPSHSWRGDVDATLIAPNGASHTVFGRTGATTATACGSSTDLTGPYVFNDTGLTTWWTVATNPTPAGTYRTTSAGGSAAGGTVTAMNPAFAGVANPNGTWLLRLTDAGGGDTGGISAATLTVDAGPTTPVDAPVDLDGDGRTNFVVVRNTGGGAGGQITWFFNLMGGEYGRVNWGISTDFFVSEDFDGDGKDDIVVWRPVSPTSATWYILNSETNTARIEAFGQSGDDPTVVGDYNNDGMADLAVYRSGAVAGAQSTWFYRTVPNGPVAYVPWGINGDFPAPGDYDGDGSNDFVVQRNNGGGQARFWRLFANGTQDGVIFGTPTDVIVPGDYDGDGKTDIAVIRGVAGQIRWFYEPSSIPDVQVVQNTWGNSATDFPTQGDYNGDGRTDLAIWRASATPGASAFWVLSLEGGGVTVFNFGQNGDYPVANFNSH